MRKTSDRTPVFLAVKANQRVFNGYGAQETSDMLFTAIIHPRMPVSLVCKDDDLWDRLYTRIVGYQKERIELLKPAPKPVPAAVPSGSTGRRSLRNRGQNATDDPEEPIQPLPKSNGHLWHHVSGRLAFRMNTDSHARFLQGVHTYRRKTVKIGREMYERIAAAGLLNPHAVIQDDGTAKGALNSLRICEVYSLCVSR